MPRPVRSPVRESFALALLACLLFALLDARSPLNLLGAGLVLALLAALTATALGLPRAGRRGRTTPG